MRAPLSARYQHEDIMHILTTPAVYCVNDARIATRVINGRPLCAVCHLREAQQRTDIAQAWPQRNNAVPLVRSVSRWSIAYAIRQLRRARQCRDS